VKTVYKLVEWEGGSGLWYCEHTSSYPEGIQKWVLPARLLGMTVDEFLRWLIDTYKPDRVYHNEDCSFVGWAWKDQSMMRKYKNYINKVAREKNFLI
jgi:hypothetical protein